MACCGPKKPKHFQQNRELLEMEAGRRWRFSNEELFELTKRFQMYAVNHKISHKNYRESLGIIGIESLSFMCDRMFNIMDRDRDGQVSPELWCHYLDHAWRVP